MSKKVLVTGGNGFIGRGIIDHLLPKGYEIHVVDNFSTDPKKQVEHSSVTYFTGSVTDADLIRSLFHKNKYDFVYHLSAVVGIKHYLHKPFELVDVNVFGTKLIIEECIKYNSRLLFTSTSEIYGKNPTQPWKEEDDRVLGTPHLERWIYSNSKAMGEHMLFAAVRSMGLRASAVRYFNIYGPKQYPTNVLPRNVCLALSGETMKVYDDGKMRRCYTYIDDAVQGTVLAAEKDEAIGEAFNIGSQMELSVIELMEQIKSISGSSSVFEYVDTKKLYDGAYEDLQRRIPCIEKSKKILGFEAKTSISAGLEKTIGWYKQNQSWWKEFKL